MGSCAALSRSHEIVILGGSMRCGHRTAVHTLSAHPYMRVDVKYTSRPQSETT